MKTIDSQVLLIEDISSDPVMSARTPTQIYDQILLPLLEDNGFRVLTRSDSGEANRLITRHRFVGQTPLRRQFLQKNECPMVDVVGIPMGHNFLIVHALVCNSVEDSVKLKLRTNDSLDWIATKLLSEFVVKLIELLSTSINDLPIELKFRILSLLPLESLLKMSLVSSQWRDVTLDHHLWRLLVKQHFPAFYFRGSEEDWKSIYKEAFHNRRLLERRKSWASRGLPPSLIFPALPPSPPLLPILGPPFVPMLPPPPAIFRDLVPEEVRNVFPNIGRNAHVFGIGSDIGF